MVNKKAHYIAGRKRGRTPLQILEQIRRAEANAQKVAQSKTAFTPNPAPEVRPS